MGYPVRGICGVCGVPHGHAHYMYTINMATNSTEVVIGNEGHHNTYKILVIGDSGVGKTALLHRYCDSTFQTSSFVATVGKPHESCRINSYEPQANRKEQALVAMLIGVISHINEFKSR